MRSSIPQPQPFALLVVWQDPDEIMTPTTSAIETQILMQRGATKDII